MSTGDYRAEVAGALAAGWRCAGLHATPASRSSGAAVRLLLASLDGDTRLVSTDADSGSVPSLVDLAPALGWDEREAHDLYGIRFEGHDPLRPLVDHSAPAAAWMTPVRGPDPYEIAVGPIHAGVIESGHFRFHVVGDKILHLDARLFYKHRGLERATEGLPFAEGIGVIGRACAGCRVANSVAYAHACEELLGLEPDPELARVRTILLELERAWNLLNDIGAICAGAGMAAGTNRFVALVDDLRALNERLTGHRFLFGSVAVGGSALDIDADATAAVRSTLDEVRSSSTRAWRELLFNGSFMDRMPDIGIVDADAVRALGTVGPAARAAGVAEDVRTSSPRLAYDGFEAAALRHPNGDIQARLEQRALEVLPCLDILDRLLADPVRPAAARPGAPERTIGVGRVESPRGETTCIVERDVDRVGRVRLRTGSYANWPAVAHAAVGDLLPDFPLINKSFELCYACADR